MKNQIGISISKNNNDNILYYFKVNIICILIFNALFFLFIFQFDFPSISKNICKRIDKMLQHQHMVSMQDFHYLTWIRRYRLKNLR